MCVCEPLAEDWLPESQCGFRKGRGCIDMIFAARQVFEKFIEHQSDLYVLFVDLHKAYNSVPRTALWLVLQKLGVPPRMLQVIRSLHEGMMASVGVDSGQSDSFGVENGLLPGLHPGSDVVQSLLLCRPCTLALNIHSA